MNCFQISIFAVANTTNRCSLFQVGKLWIAFKLVSLQLQTQRVYSKCSQKSVVNCFQISIFAVANTTIAFFSFSYSMLWIAFKLVSLQLQTQRVKLRGGLFRVVNCFQISIFAVANTTTETKQPDECQLWIAFKLVSLQLQTQLGMCILPSLPCCELLSN